MKDLIEALQIFLKYIPKEHHGATGCEHDMLTIYFVDPSEVSAEDTKRLDELGFFVDGHEECFRSFRFGS